MAEEYRRAIQKDHIHLVHTKGVAGRLDIIDERASFSVGSGGSSLAGKYCDIDIAAFAAGPTRRRPEKVHRHDLREPVKTRPQCRQARFQHRRSRWNRRYFTAARHNNHILPNYGFAHNPHGLSRFCGSSVNVPVLGSSITGVAVDRRPDYHSIMKRHDNHPLSAQYAALFGLLKEAEPIAEKYDVEWWGPYFIPRARQWHRSRFLLFGGRLFCSIEAGWTTYPSTWNISSGEVAIEGPSSFSMAWDPQALWTSALPQLTRRLKAAIENPDSFNRRVRRLIPFEARTGRVVRKWTWPKRTRTPLSKMELSRLESACACGERADSWKSLTSGKYLEIVGRAYDAAYPDMRNLAAREKYSLKADGRHGGLLLLEVRDSHAFRDWYLSKTWSGTHPWEIVFGHPHGVTLYPVPDPKTGWRFHLSVDSPGMFLHAVKMAITLGDASVPFMFDGKDRVASALRGADLVEVGPFYDQLSLADLRDVRPEAVDRVEWDPVVEIHPVSAVQRYRVSHVLRTGSPFLSHSQSNSSETRT